MLIAKIRLTRSLDCLQRCSLKSTLFLKILSLTICIAISSCGIAAGQDSSPSLVLALYIVTPGDPFNTQQPAFALYSDNKTIFRKRSVIFSKDLIQTDTPSFFRATVDDKEKRRLTDLADSMCKLSAGYSASGRTHLPLNVVWYRGSETRRIVVYGDLSPEASTMMGDTSKVPAEFMRVYKELSEYSHAGETAWIPDQIECLMEPIGAARSGLAEWPASLAQDVATRQDEVVCAVLPQEHLMAAKRLLNANGGQ